MARRPKQEETLFDAELPEGIREADQQDLRTLGEITDTAREEADIEEVKQLGGSALPAEVQIADVEEIREISDNEQARIDHLTHNGGISALQAEISVLGRDRAYELRGETPPQSTRRRSRSRRPRGRDIPVNQLGPKEKMARDEPPEHIRKQLGRQ
jgi:hypothetical protein